MEPRARTPEGENVFREIEKASPEARRAFFELVEALCRYQHPGRATELGVLPVKDDAPETYTAPFDDAMLLFQVMADYPIILLIQVTWLRNFLPT